MTLRPTPSEVVDEREEGCGQSRAEADKDQLVPPQAGGGNGWILLQPSQNQPPGQATLPGLGLGTLKPVHS